MKRIFLILLALTLILIPACGEQPDVDMEGKIHTSRVISHNCAEYGDYIYLFDDTLSRYNRRTGEIIYFCNKFPNCGGVCIFCAPFIKLTQIVDGRLYFNVCTSWTHENIYAYLDLTSEEVKVLISLPERQAAEVCLPVLDNGWLYYVAQRLRAGGEATNPEDYEAYVGRIPMDGGETEFVCLIENIWGEYLYAVVDGKVVTVHNACFYSTDIVTQERKILFEPEAHGFYNYFDKINYLDGFFYVLCGTSEVLKSEYYPMSMRQCYLLRIDARTGEMKQLVEDPVYGLTVTDDAIYYTEQAIRILYLPEDYEKHPEKVALTGSNDTIYACDLDGGNRRAVYTDPNLDVNYFNRIIDNCLYGWLRVYNEDEHQMGIRFFGKLDFATGEITPSELIMQPLSSS